MKERRKKVRACTGVVGTMRREWRCRWVHRRAYVVREMRCRKKNGKRRERKKRKIRSGHAAGGVERERERGRERRSRRGRENERWSGVMAGREEGELQRGDGAQVGGVEKEDDGEMESGEGEEKDKEGAGEREESREERVVRSGCHGVAEGKGSVPSAGGGVACGEGGR
ncbi:hypothetical protein AAC387_Pa01g2498 [Persea americana]